MTKIVTDGASILRETAKEVPLKDIKSAQIQSILTIMQKELAKESHGVAIAAPQIGKSLRIFVVAGKVFDSLSDGRDADTNTKSKHQIFINPSIIKESKKKIRMSEGCLSVPRLYGQVKRLQKVTITYFDEHANKHTRGASDFLAQIFQHEIDHLNGVLYTDKANDVHKVDKNLKRID